MKFEITHQELADARVKLANTILESENAGEILTALNKLTMTYAKKAAGERNKKSKGKSSKKEKQNTKRWKHTADEFYTILMCAVYTKQDQVNE